MRITWLLDPTPGREIEDMSGVQADALAARGHEVRIVAAERPQAFFGGRRAEWIELDDWRVVELAGDDFVIATSDQTARLAAEAAGRHAITRLDPGIVAEEVYRERVPREREPLRVLLAGASQDDGAGIEDGYGAVAHARWFHQKLELVRVAPWAPSREEPLDTIDEFHVALDQNETVRLIHSCDIAITPSRAGARSPFAAAAAMAAGLAVVMTDVPPHRFADVRDYALFAPERNAIELGERLIEVASDEEVRARLRRRGHEVAQQWHPATAGERLEQWLLARR
jgi:glycosyltransferase involved in cell wall biosynthesis